MMPALEIVDLAKIFGGLPAISGVNLSVPAGERHLILGPNGAGKTTLFNLVTGDLGPTRGSIRIFGNDVATKPTYQRVCFGVARTYQIITLFESTTLVNNVMLALNAKDRHRWSPWRSFERDQHMRGLAIAALATVGLQTVADRRVDETSYGERRRLELAMALAQRPRLLLLDEPLAGLSRAERGAVQKIIADIPNEVTVLMIEHDMDMALDFADRITVLHHGQLVMTGTRTEVAANPRVREIYFGE